MGQIMLAATRQESPGAAESPAVQAYVLGGFRVVVRGRAVEDHAWHRKTARQLFKCLLSRPSRRMTRDEVVELLWPDSDPAAASTNLRSTLHAMRRVLEPADHAGGIGVVFGDRDSVWLRPDVELWADADEFEHTVLQAWRSPDPLPLLEQASALYAGPYLPDDLYADWAVERREALKQQWAEIQIRLSHELERRGDPDAAARPLQHLLRVDPCNERAAQEGMQLLARHARRSEALRVYQRLARALADDLGVEPSDETTALQRQIAAGEIVERAHAVAATFRCAYPFPEPRALIGREAELALLERIVANGRTAGHAALVGAPAGTGKSALVGQLVKRAQLNGVLCLAGGCYEERGAVPLGPFHDALVDFLLAQPPERIRAHLGNTVEDLAQVVPELQYHLKLFDTPSSVPPAVDRIRAFGAIHACLRSLAESGPVLVCLEDLHAADEATLQLLHYLARQTRRLPLVLIATYRTDEAPADQPLAQTLVAMSRERLVQQVRLSSLGRDETDRLLTALIAGSPSAELGESLYATTGGNPLFVEQLVLALSETGQIRQQAGVWYGVADLQGTPQIVREVIAQRLARLPTSCREVLAVAAVLGQAFEHNVLLAAVEPVVEPALLDDLDRAIGAHLVQETPAGYAFRHGLLRDAVYWALSAPRRMLLHARTGEMLERFRGDRVDDYAAELAYHFTLAGESAHVRSKALRYSLRAGKRAAELSSYPESLAHFNRAWEIIERDAGLADREIRIEGLSGRGWAEANLARYPECVATYRQVLALSKDPIQRGRARKILAFSLEHIGAIPELIEECEAGLAEVNLVTGRDAIEIRATLLQLIAMARYRQGRFGEVLELGRRIEQQAEQAGPDPRMLAHKVIGWGYMGQGQVERAIVQYELAIAEAERWGNKPGIASQYSVLGQQEYLGGRFAAARKHLTRSLSLYRESANELRAAFPLNMLCRVHVAEGEHARARELILQALSLEIEGKDRFAADAHVILGLIHVLRGEWEAATASFEQALTIFRQAGDIVSEVESTVALGSVDQFAGRWDLAAARYGDALKLARAMDPSPQRILAQRCLGRLHLLAGDWAGASAEIGEVFELAGTMPATLEYAPTVLAMAELRASAGQFAEAQTLAEQALAQARPLQQVVEAQILLAQIQQSVTGAVEANVQAMKAVEHATRLGSQRLLSLANLALARALSSLDPERASATFQIAIQQATESRTPYERAVGLRAYADHLRQTGSSRELAASMEADALKIADGLRFRHAGPTLSREPRPLPATI